jgi:hypothetical protein
MPGPLTRVVCSAARPLLFELANSEPSTSPSRRERDNRVSAQWLIGAGIEDATRTHPQARRASPARATRCLPT